MTDVSNAPIRVLIVDDHRMFGDSLTLLLDAEPDIEVVGFATRGDAGIAMAAATKPDVMLIDFLMPDRDGVSVTAEIKATSPETMVVMLAGAPDDQVLLRAIEAGCSGFLTKDQAAGEVGDAIRAAAAGESLISPGILARLLPKLNRNYRAAGSNLTDRERQVLALVAKGSNNQVIASELHLSVNTVRNYVQSILAKLAAHSKLEAVAIAVREGVFAYAPTA
jgi:two-component system response regulator DevR